MHGPKFCAGFRGGLNEESSTAIKVLQGHWPDAFPQSPDLMRPLAAKGVAAAIVERTGWSKRYTASVLAVWKRQLAYSEAMLRYERRYDLAGAATDEIINERTREKAREHIAAARLGDENKSTERESIGAPQMAQAG
jgi:sRNA-binding protein